MGMREQRNGYRVHDKRHSTRQARREQAAAEADARFAALAEDPEWLAIEAHAEQVERFYITEG